MFSPPPPLRTVVCLNFLLRQNNLFHHRSHWCSHRWPHIILTVAPPTSHLSRGLMNQSQWKHLREPLVLLYSNVTLIRSRTRATLESIRVWGSTRCFCAAVTRLHQPSLSDQLSGRTPQQTLVCFNKSWLIIWTEQVVLEPSRFILISVESCTCSVQIRQWQACAVLSGATPPLQVNRKLIS